MASSDSPAGLNSTTCDESEIKKCFCLIEQGELKVVVNQPDVVLVLGITGSGKTTLVNFLAGNNQKLFAKDTGEDIGEYTIIDTENKISDESTIVSKTIFPELMTEPGTNVSFYDCTGFGDTRNMATDVAGTFFIHKILSKVKRVKFVLAVNHSSVRTGMDRADFIELLTNTFSLIKDIEKYKDSFALVVTKVENIFKNGNELIPDNMVIEQIARFLQSFKANAGKVGNDEFVRKTTILIDSILAGDHPENRRIGIFRRPMEEGSLDKQKALQDNKKHILEIVKDGLQFTDANENDFGYAISEKSKNKLHDMEDEIDKHIQREVAVISEQIRESHKNKEHGQVDVFELQKTFEHSKAQAQEFIQGIGNNLKLREFVEKLVSFAKPVEISAKQTTTILEQEKYLEFLQHLDQQKPKGSPLVWKQGLKSLVDYLDESGKWYSFLGKLQKLLSSYDVQKDVKKYGYLLSHKIFTPEDVSLKKLAESHPDIGAQFEGSQVEPVKMETLNNIIDWNLRFDVTKDANIRTEAVDIRGRFVVLGDAVRKYAGNEKILNIFAADTVFIDSDIVRQGSGLHQLSIIAPKWEIVGNRKIVLNGKDGCCKPELRAADGYYRGSRGSSGKPGIPGESAGNFFGVGATFVNGEGLSIFAEGGAGTDGQNGGLGAAGIDGESFLDMSSWRCYKKHSEDRFKKRQVDGVIFRPMCLIGEAGGNGGDGGDGGAAGEGGYAGSIQIYTTKDEPFRARAAAKQGESGNPGSGGAGGRGGNPGKSWVHEKLLWGWRSLDCERTRRQTSEYYDSCGAYDVYRYGSAGDYGIPGINRSGLRKPSSTKSVPLSSFKQRYSEFAQNELASKKTNKNLQREFLDKLQNDNFSNSYQYRRKRDVDYQPPYVTEYSKLKSKVKDIPKKFSKFYGLESRNDGHVGPQFLISDESKSSLKETPKYNVNDNLALIDLVVRAITKSKPNNYFEDCSVDYEQVRGCALDIVVRFENILHMASKEPEELSFDPVPLMGKLEKEIVNGNYKNVGKILIQAIENKSGLDSDKLYSRIKNIM